MDHEKGQQEALMDNDGGDASERVEDVGPARPAKRRGRRIVIALCICIAVVAFAQSRASDADHQDANLITAAAVAVTLLFVLYQLQRMARQRGFRFLVPAGVLSLMAILAVLFRPDGFSGEMIPQFKLRFASRGPEMRSVVSASQDLDPVASASPAAVALDNSLGFLGNSRTGVVSDRLFAIPSAVTDVELLWNQGVGAGWSSFSVVSDRAITLEQREGSECLTCYRLSDGEMLWIVSHEETHQNPLGGVGPRSTPTIDGELVYAQGATGRLWCVNWSSGEVVWSVDLLELAGWDQIASEAAITWGRAGSPLIVDGLCVVPLGGPLSSMEKGRSLVALDAKSGEPRWFAGEDQISYASPGLLTLAGKRQIVSVNEKTISGHAVDTGELLWEFDWFGQSNAGANCAMVVPVAENRFLIGKGYGGGSALVEITTDGDGKMNAEAIWDSSRILKTKFTHACVDGDTAYAISNGSLEAVSIESEKRLWTQSRRLRLGQGQVLLIDDVLVGQAESGEVVFVAADPTEYRELLRLPAMDSKTWNIPTIAGRHLLVRNDREAFCFLLPELKQTDAEPPITAAASDQ